MLSCKGSVALVWPSGFLFRIKKYRNRFNKTEVRSFDVCCIKSLPLIWFTDVNDIAMKDARAPLYELWEIFIEIFYICMMFPVTFRWKVMYCGQLQHKSVVDNCFSGIVSSGRRIARKKWNNTFVSMNNDFSNRDSICKWFPLVPSSHVKIVGKWPHSWPQSRYSC